MAYSEELAVRVRAELAHLRKVQEKKMFSGITFMVNGKMCVSVGDDRIMCRIDPSLHDAIIQKAGCQPVMMKGREYRGFVHVNKEAIKTKRELEYWINFALEFNKFAKKSKKKSKKEQNEKHNKRSYR